ncbi:Hypothetical_protein [Hexamita inflata]|uniref:Hypothetical_protein n=1 Tax=Hexamita inflata TaxID=28002 RepID=A0AA86UYW1_9EUKA|nr:Hypothetical protein HINF_LOCUS57526 [Hexamita inflata]
MTLVTLTVIALGRIHISSKPAAAIEMLCFNYTVGFFQSVAVLNCPWCVRGCKDHPAHIWQVAPLRRFPEVSMQRRRHEHSEPLFIPRLQSRFADFPWLCYLLTRGFLPRRPDAARHLYLIPGLKHYLASEFTNLSRIIPFRTSIAPELHYLGMLQLASDTYAPVMIRFSLALECITLGNSTFLSQNTEIYPLLTQMKKIQNTNIAIAVSFQPKIMIKQQSVTLCVWSVFIKIIIISELIQIQILQYQKYYISCISTYIQICIKFYTQNKKQLQSMDSFIKKKQTLLDTTTVTLSTCSTLNCNEYKHKYKFNIFFKFTTIPICQRRVRLLLYESFMSHITLIQTFNKILCIISINITDLAFIILGMKIVLGHNKILCC